MAQKKTPVKKRLTGKDWKGFVNYRITNDEKKHVAEIRTTATIEDIIQSLADDDFKVSVEWDAKQKCYRGSIYRFMSGYPDAGYTYSVWHSDIRTILVIIHHVVYVRFDGNLPGQGELDFNW